MREDDFIRIFFLRKIFFIIFILAILQGCALPNLASGGGGCIGFGCGGQRHFASVHEARSDNLKFVLYETSEFSTSIKPSVDNFLNRYRTGSDRAQLTEWINEFFDPARRIIGSEFSFEPKLTFSVDPKKPIILVTVAQDEPAVFSRGDAMHEKLAALSGVRVFDVQNTRLSVSIEGQISVISETTILFVNEVKMVLETQKSSNEKFLPVTHPDENALIALKDRLVTRINNNYAKFLEKRYGLKVTKLTSYQQLD